MKPCIALGILCLLITSCKNKQQELKEKLIPIVKSEVLAHEAIKIDSISIFKIDTLSDSLYYELRSNKLYHLLKAYINMRGYYFNRQKDLTNQAEEAYNNAHMELYTPDEAEFRREQMNVYKQRLDEADNYKNEVQKYSDTLKVGYDEVVNIENKIKSKKIKKDNFLGYYVHFKLLGANTKDNSEVRLDSLAMCVSPNFRIMDLSKL